MINKKIMITLVVIIITSSVILIRNMDNVYAHVIYVLTDDEMNKIIKQSNWRQ